MSASVKPRNKVLFIVLLLLVFSTSLYVGVKANDKPKKFTYIQNPAEVLSASTTSDSGSKIDIIKSETSFTASGLDSGTKKVSVTFDLANKSDKILEFSPGLNLRLVDNAGIEYAPTMKFANSDTIIGGPTLPGQKNNYSVDFEVPIDSNLTNLLYQKTN